MLNGSSDAYIHSIHIHTYTYIQRHAPGSLIVRHLPCIYRISFRFAVKQWVNKGCPFPFRVRATSVGPRPEIVATREKRFMSSAEIFLTLAKNGSVCKCEHLYSSFSGRHESAETDGYLTDLKRSRIDHSVR